MAKSPDAFRTISEVAEWLDVPTHVLRFWESRFNQVKPVKRAGGRRYYRPADMQLLGGIKRLLHDEGLTIRGVQKLLREEGVRHVAALAPTLDGAEWEPGGKVISIAPSRAGGTDESPDRWPFTDEAEAAVDTLAGQIGAEREVPKLVENGPTADGVAENTSELSGEPAASDSPVIDEPLEDQELAEPVSPEVEHARAPLPDIPLPDLDAIPVPPLCVSPLVARGRGGRQRRHEVLAPVAARALALIRDLDRRI